MHGNPSVSGWKRNELPTIKEELVWFKAGISELEWFVNGDFD